MLEQAVTMFDNLTKKVSEQKTMLDNFFGGLIGFDGLDYSLAFENLYSLIKNSNQLVNDIKILDEKIKVFENCAVIQNIR